MFFKFDEKTLHDAIRNQQERERVAKEKEGIDYDGHKLTFAESVDGNVVILSEPSLIVEAKVEGQSEGEPTGSLEIFTPSGWRPHKG